MRGEVRATATDTCRGGASEALVELEEGKKTTMWPCRGVVLVGRAGVEAGQIDGDGHIGSPRESGSKSRGQCWASVAY